MEKIGVDISVNKSGNKKDMGSPFRPATEEEMKIFQDLTQSLAQRFIDLVKKNRKIQQSAMADVTSARIFLAEEALGAGLVDQIGYLSDAIKHAKKIAGLPEDAKVIAYRRSDFADDNIYNPATTGRGRDISLIDPTFLNAVPSLDAGFYYIWPIAAGFVE
jgi:protease-4